ncbi:MAG: hypothetical protein QOF33_1282 [Thermomicrobiales bacterium]|nr:hypothetical protein [Thermomicrobiales bacterium]
MVHSATLPPLVRGTWYPMSWEKFLEWSPDEGQAEWIDGKGIAYVSNSARHMRMLGFLAELFRVYVRVLDLGEVFFDSMLLRLPTRPPGRMPDIFIIGRSDQERLRDQWFEGPALLVVEFVSDESVQRDLIEKRDEYERAGVPEYLAIDTRLDRQGFTYLQLDHEGRYQPIKPDADGRYHSAALSGFWIDPAWFRQDPLPSVERLMVQIAPRAYRRYLAQLLVESDE